MNPCTVRGFILLGSSRYHRPWRLERRAEEEPASVAGKPLIVWTIERALEFKTDFIELSCRPTTRRLRPPRAKPVPTCHSFRPAELAGDETDSLAVVQHATDLLRLRKIANGLDPFASTDAPLRPG